jgi:hypothetical protein
MAVGLDPMTPELRLNLLLVSIPALIDAIAAIMFPRWRKQILAIGALAVIALVAGATFGAPSPSIWDRLAYVVPVLAVTVWLMAAQVVRSKDRARIDIVASDLTGAKSGIDEEKRVWKEELQRIHVDMGHDREWTHNQFEHERTSLDVKATAALTAVRGELIKLRQEDRKEIEQHTDAIATLKVDVAREAVSQERRLSLLVDDLRRELITDLNKAAEKLANMIGDDRAELKQESDRWAASVRDITGRLETLDREVSKLQGPPNNVYNSSTGERYVRPPIYPNVAATSEQLDKVSKALAEVIKEIEANKGYYQRGIGP